MTEYCETTRPSSLLSKVRYQFRVVWYRQEVTLPFYMLESWERGLVYLTLISIASLLGYTVRSFILPVLITCVRTILLEMNMSTEATKMSISEHPGCEYVEVVRDAAALLHCEPWERFENSSLSWVIFDV
ncbi:hypothetical protein EJ05DRAFT_475090 [Pseudovirgaria hyperparasitica]|uniref:Uncharacterized protein n=1 Tax=Pseudovirgaria hyperparasitica TaxID=470096 RepID=A0A6A6W860_9PEZI|nr:uncharacterized protein EJ05DRAFT_475090 [Pseudovirgaria hyperparasitica]KAF2758833.1 hypothetical protein EJ05DRAFT_475090 [Pseudovirgaria hyperparasitica]